MNYYFHALLLPIIFATLGFAEQTVPTIDTSLPVEIKSQQLEMLQQGNKSVFSGDVIVTQGDMTLSADLLVVFFIEDNQIERLEATGNVRFSQLNRVATAEKAIYYQQEEKLLLLGNAVAQQGRNLVSGDEIIFYVVENRSVIKGSSQNRVKAIIVQEQKKDVE